MNSDTIQTSPQNDTTHIVCISQGDSYMELEFSSFVAANECYAMLLKSTSQKTARVWSVRKGEFL